VPPVLTNCMLLTLSSKGNITSSHLNNSCLESQAIV
jgi:hypothetical protein